MLAPCIWGPARLTIEQQNAWIKVRTELGIYNTRPNQYEAHKELVCDALEEIGIDIDL